MKILLSNFFFLSLFISSTLAQRIVEIKNLKKEIKLLQTTNSQNLVFTPLPFQSQLQQKTVLNDSLLLTFFTAYSKDITILDSRELARGRVEEYKFPIDSLLFYDWSLIEMLASDETIRPVEKGIIKTNRGKTVLESLEKKSIQTDKDSTSIQQRKLLYEIEKLSEYQERLYLKLLWVENFIKADSFYETTNAVFENALRELYFKRLNDSSFSSKHLANAFAVIGIFLSDNGLIFDAVTNYYNAIKVLEYDEKIDTLVKFNRQAELYNSIATTFAMNSDYVLWDMACNLLLTSRDLFQRAHNFRKSNLAQLKYYTYRAALLERFSYTNSPNAKVVINHAERMAILQTAFDDRWFFSQESDNEAYEIKYFQSICIAIILRSEGKLEASKQMFLLSLFYAMKRKDVYRMEIALEDLANVYATTRDKKSALYYCDKVIALRELKTGKIDYDGRVLKGWTYLEFKDIHSASQLAHLFLKDTSLIHNIYSPIYRSLQNEFFDLQASILDSLQSDSANFYKLKASEGRIKLLGEAIYYFNSQTSSLLELSKVAEARNINIQSAKITAAQQIVTFQDEISKLQNDSIVQVNLRNITLDSLATAKDTIAKQKTAIANAKQREVYYTYGITLFFLISLFIGSRRYIKSFRARHKAENEHLNHLARNKIHNFKSDIAIIETVVLHSLNKELNFQFFQVYNRFLDLFSKNWSRKPLCLKHELDEFQAYVDVSKFSKNVLILGNVLVENQEKLLFLNSIFDTLFSNSVKHGFASKQEGCIFSYAIYIKDEFVICDIFDNGTPPEDNSRYFKDPEDGLNILKRRVQLHFKYLGQIFKDDYFQVSALDNRNGTFIKICLPYAEA